VPPVGRQSAIRLTRQEKVLTGQAFSWKWRVNGFLSDKLNCITHMPADSQSIGPRGGGSASPALQRVIRTEAL